MRRKGFILFTVLLTVLLFSAFSTYGGEEVVGPPAPAPAPGTYYVDISQGTDDIGYGTSPGTGAWKTLHYAIGLINLYVGTPGPYTLNVASGTYEVVDTEKEANTPLNITQGNVTVIGDFISKPILSGPANPQAREWEVGIITNGDNITIRDLEIQNFSNGGIHAQGDNTTIYHCDIHDNFTTGIKISTEATVNGGIIKRCNVYNNATGIWVMDAQNIVVEQNIVHNNTAPSSGIYVSLATTGVVIKKNQIENNDTGIQIHECSPVVERNEIKDNATGIKIIGLPSPASPEIYNNLIYGTDSQMYDGIKVDGSSGSASPLIYHNTIDYGLSNGIEASGYLGSCIPDIMFNIITNFGTYGIYNDQGAPTIDYNDVWNNTTANYSGCSAGSHDIAQDPLFASYELQSGSPCIDKIPSDSGDPVTKDLPGYKRPRDTGYDMGAYEYVSDITHNYNLPGGTGQVTDYRMFTIPVNLETGASLKETMENALGTYDKGIWRVFAWDPNSFPYIEMDDPAFGTLEIYPGRGFWAISLGTDLIPFSGRPAPDGEYYTIPLKPGWNMFGLPWPKDFPDIGLGKIAVSDGVNNYWITSTNNTLTQKSVWDYTGSGPSNGYVQLTDFEDFLKPGSGYWINVLVNLPVELLIPPDNRGGYFSALSLKGYLSPSTSGDSGEEPPPPPGGVSSESTGVENTAKGSCFMATAAE